ncbi:MAG: flagellar basal body rod protein FlgC [Clostridiales bacterium]|jgi:flagellar basal-body rod protein FlgC|nr:flagellar basal body rod protein FlgC [Clostridiales bacterium]
MGFINSLNISASALTAQRLRMDTIAQNVANATTTRTADGTPYRRRVTVMKEKKESGFKNVYKNAQGASPQGYAGIGNGVKVDSIIEDPTDYRMEYDPSHPDADEDGYVAYPNVDEVVELVDMMSATRMYEANVTAFNATKAMIMKAFEIGK